MDAMKSCLSIVDNELEETCWVRGSPRKSDIRAILRAINELAIADHNSELFQCCVIGSGLGYGCGGEAEGDGTVRGFDEGVKEKDAIQIGSRFKARDKTNSFLGKVASWFSYEEGPIRSSTCRLNASQDSSWLLSKCWYHARASPVTWNATSASRSSGRGRGMGESLYFEKFMCEVLSMSVVRLSERVVMWVTKFVVVVVWASILVVKDLVASIKVVSWVVLRSAGVLVAEMSYVRRSVSGGWLSSPVVSRRGGMAAGELRMKAPNDGTTTSTGEERKS
ncbi:hypothetical protein Tco_1139768 [Tanacetum coccineum]